MLTFDLNKPREVEIFGELIASLQGNAVKFEVEQRPASYQVNVHFLNSKGERI